MRFGDYFLLRLVWQLVWTLVSLVVRIILALILLPFGISVHSSGRRAPRLHARRYHRRR